MTQPNITRLDNLEIVVSDENKAYNAFFLPRLTDAQMALLKPRPGEMIYNLTQNGFMGYVGGDANAWKKFSTD